MPGVSTTGSLSASLAARLLVAIYAASGLTSLAYEVLWARMLSLQFGVSIFGVIAVVVAFMGGLGLGSLFGVRVSARVRNPLRLFAILEAGIALFALTTPELAAVLSTALTTFGQGAGVIQWYILHGAALTVMLLLPAMAMGIGFPMILAAARGGNVSLGWIYGWNTLGGAIGALLPLMLLPAIGWLSAIQWVAAIGALIAVAAFVLSSQVSAAVAMPSAAVRPSLTALLAYAGVGMASLMLEIGWSRLFGMVLLRTEYVLAVLLAVFLTGIALGSLIAKRIHTRAFEFVPLAAGLAAMASLWLLPVVSNWAETAEFASWSGAIVGQGGVLALIMFPVTLLLGMWLPLLAQRFGDPMDAGARLYAVNSIGAACGALLAGVVLIPWLGSSATIVIAAIVLVACGGLWARPAWRWIGLAVTVMAALPVWHLPPVNRLLSDAQAGSRDVFVYEDAVSITHVVEDGAGQRLLLSDLQRMDASTEPAAIASQLNQGRLPLLLHPAPQTVLFLGLGTGISAAGSLPFIGLERTAVELSQGAIFAARTLFAPANNNVMDLLTVYRDDARRFLATRANRYDVIVGDLFHPDLAGRSALLSLQQFQRVRQRLTDDGIFVQWLALNQFDQSSLEVVLRTFATVFPNAVLFVDGFRLALVGPRDQLRGAEGILANVARLDADRAAAATGEEGPWSWLGRYWGPLQLDHGPIQDEWAPTIEYQLPKARYRGDLDVAELLAFLLAHRPSLQAAVAALAVPGDSVPSFERAFVATDLAMRSWLATLRGRADEGHRLMRLAYEANPKDRWISLTMADRMYDSLSLARQRGMDERQALSRILQVYPDHPDALKALWRIESSAGRADSARALRLRLSRVSPMDADVTTEAER